MIPYEDVLRERTDTNYGLSIIRKTIITRFFAGVIHSRKVCMSIDSYRLYLKDYPDDPYPGHTSLFLYFYRDGMYIGSIENTYTDGMHSSFIWDNFIYEIFTDPLGSIKKYTTYHTIGNPVNPDYDIYSETLIRYRVLNDYFPIWKYSDIYKIHDSIIESLIGIYEMHNRSLRYLTENSYARFSKTINDDRVTVDLKAS